MLRAGLMKLIQSRSPPPSSAPSPAIVPASQVRSRPSAFTGLVLAVDDEPIIRRKAKQTLESFGYTVIASEDGAKIGLRDFQIL
jgi:hypothetical protein